MMVAEAVTHWVARVPLRWLASSSAAGQELADLLRLPTLPEQHQQARLALTRLAAYPTNSTGDSANCSNS